MTSAAEIRAYLLEASYQVWAEALETAKPETRERIEGLAEIGVPAILIPLDAAWKLAAPARVVVVLEGTGPDGQDEFGEVGKTKLTDDARTALIHLRNLAIGDPAQRTESEIHKKHGTGELTLFVAVDMKRQAVRLGGSWDGGKRNLCLFELVDTGPPAVYN